MATWIVFNSDAFSAALEAGLPPGADRPAPLGAWGDWLVMAANLALLRSRLLLPPDAAEATAARAEAEDLRRHLLGRAQARAAAAWLDRQDQLGRDVFVRGALTRDALAQEALPEGDTVALLRACLLVLKVPGPDTYQPRRPVLWTLGQAIARMTGLLTEAPESGRLESFLPRMPADQQDYSLLCRAAVASTFLASLELAKEGRATVKQGDDETIWCAPTS